MNETRKDLVAALAHRPGMGFTHEGRQAPNHGLSYRTYKNKLVRSKLLLRKSKLIMSRFMLRYIMFWGSFFSDNVSPYLWCRFTFKISLIPYFSSRVPSAVGEVSASMGNHRLTMAYLPLVPFHIKMKAYFSFLHYYHFCYYMILNDFYVKIKHMYTIKRNI